MATYATGVTVTFDSTNFGEVVDLQVNAGGKFPLARGSTWTFDGGTIDVSCLGAANVSMANYGKKAALTIAGGGLAFSAKAVCERVQLRGTVNDIARYAVLFKIVPE
jgi:hypothetical protein